MLQYYAVVRNLFNNIKPLLEQNHKKKIIKQYQENLNVIYSKLMEWYLIKNRKYPIDVYKAIETVHADLLDSRQMIGIGIPMNRKYGDKTIIRKGLHVSKINI